jgi:hypothetical protein
MRPFDKKGQATILDYQALEFNVPIREAFFSLQNMKPVR